MTLFTPKRVVPSRHYYLTNYSSRTCKSHYLQVLLLLLLLLPYQVLTTHLRSINTVSRTIPTYVRQTRQAADCERTWYQEAGLETGLGFEVKVKWYCELWIVKKYCLACACRPVQHNFFLDYWKTQYDFRWSKEIVMRKTYIYIIRQKKF